MSLVKPSDTVTVQFAVTDPSTGAATDADSLPTGTLIRNGADTGETVTVQNVTTGVYSAAVTIPAGYAAGDEVQLRIAATVGGVAGQSIVWSAQVDTLRNADIAADVWDEVLTGATHNIATSAGRRLRELGAISIESGTAQTGGDHSITLATEASATDFIYRGCLVVLTAGTGAGQARHIVRYTGATRVANVQNSWQIIPDATTEYQIIGDQIPVSLDHGTAEGGTISSITLDGQSVAQDDYYIGSLVVITAGTGKHQARLIADYVGSTRVASVSPDWITAPDTTSVYLVMPVGRSEVDSISPDAQAEIWEYTTRTLTSSAAAVTSAVKGSVLNIVPTVTFSATISGLTIPSDWDKIYFTIKEDKDDADSESIAQLVVTNGGDAADGIVYLNKTAIASSDANADDGSLTVDQGAGTVDININDEATAELLNQSGGGGRHYDLKALKTDNESELLTESTASFSVSTTRTHTA